MKLRLTGFYFLLFAAIGFYSCHQPGETTDIIPKPNFAEMHRGTFSFDDNTRVYLNFQGKERENFRRFLEEAALHLTESEKPGEENSLNLLLVTDKPELTCPEGYLLDVTPSQVIIQAADGAGLFYGVQSLLQLIPENKQVQAMSVIDNPRFPYRGLHLDVSRHFRTKEFVKKQLDMMAYYKLNRLHWHLTDGAGWRIEIKKYPLLTDVAAWRPFEVWKEWWRGGARYCSKDDPGAYGGYYTREDIKEVVAYAADRYITVIPEIEMPGHSEEVLAVYPELSCAGKPYVNSDYCIGNEKTFTFLEDVLAEVMELFPSRYIHVGGDEATKKGWKECPKCHARMKSENLSNVDELQSYMIHRIEKYLNAHGRDLLGWDEILEGGLAPNATVMSWRGEEGGLAAANLGHHAVMTPGAYCYLDAYQDAPGTQPEAISGYLPLKKVYSYNPVPDSLDVEKRDLILGVQGNTWAEYIITPEHLEYMMYPRLLALAEVGWTHPEKKEWSDFHRRALKAVAFLQSRGYNTFDLSKEVGERAEALQPVQHLATGKVVHYNCSYRNNYKAAGDATLTDGLRGGWTYSDGRWQGFLEDIDVTIDLGGPVEIHSISADFIQNPGPYVWVPKEVVISVSDNNQDFTELERIAAALSEKQEGVSFQEFGWNGKAKTRYIRYQARSNGIKGGWLFTDEIIVR